MDARGLEVGARASVRHPLFWEREGDRWYWRTMFERLPLPLSWPVYVSQAEAPAFARWKGARLPSEAEYQRAAVGSPAGERRYPWGNFPPQDSARRVRLFELGSRAGRHPSARRERLGRRGFGRQRLGMDEHGVCPVSRVPRDGVVPEYSADFFDGQHFVMKGASPATARELMRPTFRNWFRAHYPYVYAAFRCARSV